MDSSTILDPDTHTYYHSSSHHHHDDDNDDHDVTVNDDEDDAVGNSRIIPVHISVTKWIGLWFPAFDASAMAATLSLSCKAYADSTPSGILQKWTASRDRGVLLHEHIERFLAGVGDNVSDDAFVVDGCIAIEFAQFRQFYADHVMGRKLSLVGAEVIVYDVQHDIAGSIDAVFQCPDGSCVLYDWKLTPALKKNGLSCGYGPLAEVPNCTWFKYALQLLHE